MNQNQSTRSAPSFGISKLGALAAKSGEIADQSAAAYVFVTSFGQGDFRSYRIASATPFARSLFIRRANCVSFAVTTSGGVFVKLLINLVRFPQIFLP